MRCHIANTLHRLAGAPMLAAAWMAAAPAQATDGPPLVRDGANPPVRISSAAVFEFSVRFEGGRGLSQLLAETGIDLAEAVKASSLASADVGRQSCVAKVAVSRGPNRASIKLERLTVTTETSQITIDRRGDTLVVVQRHHAVTNGPRFA